MMRPRTGICCCSSHPLMLSKHGESFGAMHYKKMGTKKGRKNIVLFVKISTLKRDRLLVTLPSTLQRTLTPMRYEPLKMIMTKRLKGQQVKPFSMLGRGPRVGAFASFNLLVGHQSHHGVSYAN